MDTLNTPKGNQAKDSRQLGEVVIEAIQHVRAKLCVTPIVRQVGAWTMVGDPTDHNANHARVGVNGEGVAFWEEV